MQNLHSPVRLRSAPFIKALLFVVACDGGPALDAGTDAGLDAGRDAGTDAGVACSLTCGDTETCCTDPDGTELCVTLRNDPRHCGTCAVDCIETDRGDGCSANQCTCGRNLLGCAGGRNSFCCPGRGPGDSAYCTDLDTTPSDCGGCGIGCDGRVSSHCEGGDCFCGDERRQCAGDPELCCADGPDIRCVDTSSDPFHCGRCGMRCAAGASCVDGACFDPAICSPACVAPDVCCNGTCCPAARCTGTTCMPSADAGM